MVAASLIFASPWWLLALPILAAGAVVFWRISRRYSERRIGLFVSPSSVKEAVPAMDRRLQMLRFAMPVLAVACVCFALARPLVGPRPGHAERKGVDFVVALDVSKSMWAEDLTPNRLDAVKKELSTWLEQAAGDRMGLVLFAGEAVIQAPVTFDYQALERVLKAASPRSISKGGTNIPKAIEMASTLLNKSGLDTRALVIFTDGENLDGDALAAARQAHDNDGLSIFTVGVGSVAGAKVPQIDHAEFAKLQPSQKQRRGYIRNEYGTEVVSSLDENALRAIATAGGGRYEAFVADSGFFQRLRDTALLPLAKNRKILNVQDYYEWFPLPLFAAILLLMLEPLISTVKRRGTSVGVGVAVVRPETFSSPVEVPVSFPRKTGAGVLSVAIFWLSLTSLPAETDLRSQAERLLKEGKGPDAVALVRAAANASPGDALLAYNLGLTLYQAGQFEEAIEIFQNLKTSTADEGLRAKALFQLGNAQFRLGEKLGSQPAAVLSMERALAFYDELLSVRSSSDGRFNQEAARKALQEVLTKIAAERLKAADDMERRNDTARLSRVLQEALEAQERLTTLDPKDKKLAEDRDATKRRLAESLKNEAEKHIAETDKLESQNKPEEDRKVLGRRDQGIALLQQAKAQAPNDQEIDRRIQEEQTKMSNLITKRAEEKIVPALAKEKTGSSEMAALDRGRQDLAKALELDANNARAKELKTQAEERLEKEILAQAKSNLAAAERQADARSKLRSASSAGEQFQRVQDINPESQPAKEGLEKVGAMLPELHAAAASLDLAEAKKLLGEGKKSSDNLKKAVGYLETSTQNYARSLALKPEDQNAQQGYDQAQKLLSASRDQLDQQRQMSAQAGEPSQEGMPQEQAAQGQPATPPKMQIYNQRQPTAPAVSSGSFWNKNNRDW